MTYSDIEGVLILFFSFFLSQSQYFILSLSPEKDVLYIL